MAPDRPQAIPLLFSFKEFVSGEGFFARVQMNGRALLEVEQDREGEEIWITGIAPVGIAARGEDRGSAFIAFRRAWVEVVFDLAAEASSFDDFDKLCRGFFSSEQDSMTRLWADAVQDVRQKKYEDPTLRREDSDSHRVRFDIVDLTGFNPVASPNIVEPPLQVAA